MASGSIGPPPRSSYKTNTTTSLSLLLHKKLAHSPITTSNQRHPNEAAGRPPLLLPLHSTKQQQHGEVPVLRAGAHQQGRLDQGGGPAPRRLHQGARRGVLEVAAQGRRPAPVRQELPPALDQLPPPGPQARQLHRGGGRAHHQVPRPVRQQVVADRREAAGPDGQRDKELLEHAHQAQAPRPRHRPADAPSRRRSDATAAAAGELRRVSARPPPARPLRRRGPVVPLAGAVQPQQRRRAAVRHPAAPAGHRPQPVHQPRAVPGGAGGVRGRQQAGAFDFGPSAAGDSRQRQCGARVLVPQQPRVPPRRRVRLRPRRCAIPAAAEPLLVSHQSSTSGALLQRPIV